MNKKYFHIRDIFFLQIISENIPIHINRIFTKQSLRLNNL